jgi:putative ABC transport system permease protein
MPDPRSQNRPMFWRIVRRLITANRGRLIVILLALGAGAAVTSALLNLQVDAKRRLTTDFRALGANVVVAPRANANNNDGTTLEETVLHKIPANAGGHEVQPVAFLYVVAEASAANSQTSEQIVVAGKSNLRSTDSANAACLVGQRVSERTHVQPDELLSLRTQGRDEKCPAKLLVSSGGADDDQIAVSLAMAQRLAALPGRVSMVQISVPGTPREIDHYVASLAQQLPEADVHGIRQFTEAEAKIYNRIAGLLTATVVVVLILTTLCVMAAMTNVAMERKNDVGLMKAIGGATRRVLRLFLAEAAMLGLIGGVTGAAAGLFISIGLGKAVFGVAAQPRLIVYPVAVALTILVAVAGAYPLRRLASIRPASVFRGEA